MRVLFDTSALIPALVLTASNHAEALSWLEKAQRKEIEGYVSAHGIAELYGFLSGHGKLAPEDVQRILDTEIIAHLAIAALTENEYRLVVKDAASMGFAGAIIFDCIHAYVAGKVTADIILTGNNKDFVRICPQPPPAIVTLQQTFNAPDS